MTTRTSAMANAAPEWQAGRLGRRSSGLMVACPLEGLVRRYSHASQEEMPDRDTPYYGSPQPLRIMQREIRQ